MIGLSKRDIAFLVGAAIVLLIFFSVGAGASTYAWFLLSATALWSASRARSEARLRSAALEAALQAEREERIRNVARLRERIRELEERTSTAPDATEPTASRAARAVETSADVAGEKLLRPSAPTPVVASQETAAAAAATIAPASTPPVLTTPLTATPQRDWADTIRRFLDLEQMLGTNWLSKLGVGVLVLGIAFFLAWRLAEVGPLGKVVTGVVVSAILLSAGIWGDRHRQYQLLGRAALAGGWALLYFVAYAAYHVPATHVLESPLFDLVIMLTIVTAMVLHTLRFRSQVVTGLGFLLAFATVAMNRVDLYSLSSNVILAIGLCLVVVRMQWFEMETLGLLAVYLNHYLWLTPIIEPMHGRVRPFPEFAVSTTLLVSYWAVFRASYVVRSPKDEKTSALAGVLNSVLLLGVMKYQSAHPELAFGGLLVLGLIELGLAQLPLVRRKRTTFVVLTAIGASLIVAAIPFRFAADYVSALWLVEAQLFFVVGVLTGERVFRRLGSFAAGLTAMQLLAVHGARILGEHLGGAAIDPHGTLGAIFVAATLVLYVDGSWAPRRWPALFERPVDRRLAHYLSHAAAAVGVVGAWVLFPGAGAAVAWIALAVALAAIGRRFAMPDLTLQANGVAVLALVRALVVNLPSNDVAIHAPFGITYRLLTVSAIVGLFYLLSRWNRSDALRLTTHLPGAVTWTATALGSLLAWYELRPLGVAIAWTLFGLSLLEAGEARRSLSLRLQAYVVLAAAFLRVFIVNLNVENAGAVIGPRLYTILPIVLGLLYVHQRLYGAGEGHERERQARLPSLFAWLAAMCIVALLRFECPTDAVALAWAALTLASVALASIADRRVFLHIGIALSLATLGRTILHDLYERSYFPWPGKADPWLLVGGTAALLLASLPFAFRLRRPPVETTPVGRRILIWLDARPEQVLFFVPLVLVTALLATEMRRDLITVAWGIEAVIVFVSALRVQERSYRLAGLVLLLLCAAKVLLIDFWSLGIRDKALTGIVMGLALIGVSVLYTHKRDVIRQFL
jgi:hypothetical protein